MTNLKENSSGQEVKVSREEMIKQIKERTLKRFKINQRLNLANMIRSFAGNIHCIKKSYKSDLVIEAFIKEIEVDIRRNLLNHKGEELYFDEQDLQTIKHFYNILLYRKNH